jgi:hypothetical protein
VKNIVIKYAFLQGMLIPYSSQNGFIYLRAEFAVYLTSLEARAMATTPIGATANGDRVTAFILFPPATKYLCNAIMTNHVLLATFSFIISIRVVDKTANYYHI